MTTDELAQDDFLKSVRGALAATDLSPCHIELAFSETSLVNASRQVKERLEELRQWGVELAVSDFGASYAALMYLEDLDFATVRLDASFAQRLAAPLCRPHYFLAVIRGLLAVADDLNITVVATGVKSSDEMRLFRSLGCSVQQGPLFTTSAASQETGAWTDAVSLKTGAAGRFTN